MKPPKDMEQKVRNASVDMGEATDKRILKMMQETYNQSSHLPAAGQVTSSPWRVPKLAVAAAILLVVGAFLGRLGEGGGGSVAWADVAARFQSVPFFNATVYIKSDGATGDPMQMELWWSHDGRARIRVGSQVIFARDAQVTDAFDIATRGKVKANEWAGMFLARLAGADVFSLDAVVELMFRSDMEDVTPLVNSDAVISQDMVVFDVEIDGTPEWVRIWALRESRLPVRIRVWDPRDGEMSDAVFEYAREQSAEFFDPNAFGELLRNSNAANRANIAYAFLKDPGGKEITPQDMFDESGYHVPVVEQAGITPDGAVWIIAARGSNRMPNGRMFYGFARIEDDLGRQYTRLYRSHRTGSDQSMDVFVPQDYPFDERQPARLTLVSEADDGRPPTQDEVVGTVELTDWKADAVWPQGTIYADLEQLHLQMASRDVAAERYDRAIRILDSIGGSAEGSEIHLDRDKVRLEMLLKQEAYDAAATLAERLLPLLETEYIEWDGTAPNPEAFADCLQALAYDGRLDEVKRLWRHLKSIEPELPASLTQGARRMIAEDIERGFEACLRLVVPGLSHKGRLTIEQLNDLFDIDIKHNELFEHYTFWDWDPAYERPEYKNWERHLEELSEYYQSHPLPETMEILPRDTDEPYAVHLIKMPGIDSHYVENLRGPLKNYAVFYEYPGSVGCVRTEGDVANLALNHDLIYRVGTPQSERIVFMLGYLGLEIVEVNEPRTVWVARYDGRELADPQTVYAPVPHGPGPTEVGMMSASTSSGFGLSKLFTDFMWWQDRDLQADCILIIDETGLEGPVSRDSPRWTGPKAPAMAREWFAEQFGVTFTEETREMTTYIIRPRR